MGECLDDRYVDWRRIVKTADDLLGAEDSASSKGTHVFQLYFGALDEADEAIDEATRFFKLNLR